MLLMGCSVLYNSLPGNTEIQDIHQSRGLGIINLARFLLSNWYTFFPSCYLGIHAQQELLEAVEVLQED